MSRLGSSIPILLLMALHAPLAAQNFPSYPEEVSLAEEGRQVYVYRRASTSQRLYTYDLDRPGQSSCNLGCATMWPPVLAPRNAVPIGDWTAVARSDGSRQWALKGKPVYTYLDDKPEDPSGDGVGGVWHLLPNTLIPATPVGAAK